MSGEKLTDKMLIDWVKHQIALRKMLEANCTVDGEYLAYASEVSNSMLIYDHKLHSRVAKLFGRNVFITPIDCDDSRRHRVAFVVDDMEIVTYCNDKEIGDYDE